MSASVFIGLGSNIDPERNLEEAADMLRKGWPAMKFSKVYKTAAQGHTDQADFLNAVAMISTDNEPEEILRVLRAIEKKLGKSPPFRFGPRTIDLDLLLYGDEIYPSMTEWKKVQSGAEPAEGDLVIPHTRMHERRFVLEPLCELADADWQHPVLGKTWKELLEAAKGQECAPFSLTL